MSTDKHDTHRPFLPDGDGRSAAGVIGKEPATVEPDFLDSLASEGGLAVSVTLC